MNKVLVVIFACTTLLVGNVLAAQATLDSTAASAQPAMESTSAITVESASPATDAAEAAKEADTRKLMALNGTDKIAESFGKQMVDRMKTALPRVPQSFWDDFMKKVKPEEIDKGVAAVYDKYLTEDDIKALLDFYATPAGKKSLAVMPKIQTDIYQVVQQWSRQLGQEAKADLEKEGYLSGGRPSTPPSMESTASSPAVPTK